MNKGGGKGSAAAKSKAAAAATARRVQEASPILEIFVGDVEESKVEQLFEVLQSNDLLTEPLTFSSGTAIGEQLETMVIDVGRNLTAAIEKAKTTKVGRAVVSRGSADKSAFESLMGATEEGEEEARPRAPDTEAQRRPQRR